MQSKSAELQNQINDIDRKIQEGVNLSSRNQLEADRNNLNEQLQAALFEESQQNLQERVEQAKETGYLLDTLESNGIPLIELSHTPENHELVAIAVQKAFLAQQDAFNRELEEANEGRLNAVEQVLRKIEECDEWSKKAKQAEIEKDDSYKKLENAARIMNEQAEEINKLKEQLAGDAVPIAALSAEEQDTKLIADLMGNRLKVTNIRNKDASGIDRRKVLANNALTGEEIEEFEIYSRTRWDEISEEAAEQLRAEYNSKKAVIELSIPVLETPAIPFVNEDTRQDEAATDKAPNETDQVDANTVGENQAEQGNQSLHAMVEQTEIEVVSRAEFEALKAEVVELKATANRWAA